MLVRQSVGLDGWVDTLKAAAESSRLRILLLLARGDLTVTDLTDILHQSQPRVSRHLKLLLEARLIERYQEGSWAYFRLSDEEASRDFLDGLLRRIDPSDATIERDMERMMLVKRRRQERASDYFRANAESWDRLRSLHVPESEVETALRAIVGERPIQTMADLGTGTGRMLELFAPIYRRGVGVDMSREMLAVARANLEKAGVQHAQVRQGDLYAPPVERDSIDLVTIHQVLHYLDDPAIAVREAARLLRPAGRLVIVDFAAHELESLRDEHAHVRLGFSDEQMSEWLEACGLELSDTHSFSPDGVRGDGLTVKLWLARDQRLLVAGEDDLQTASQTPERTTI